MTVLSSLGFLNKIKIIWRQAPTKFPFGFLPRRSCLFYFRFFQLSSLLRAPKHISKMADMMYFMGQNKKKEATKKKEREEKAKLKDVNMAAPSFDRAILNDQHKREQDAKAKARAQPAENAKFDMAKSLFGNGGGGEEEEEE